MKTEIFNFKIPDELIAQNPIDIRSNSRLLVYSRKSQVIIDSYTKHISEFLSKEYFLVFNNSKVIPARLNIIKKDNNKTGQILILKIIDSYTIEIITDKFKKYPISTKIILPEDTNATIINDTTLNTKIIKADKPVFTIEYLEKYGKVPLPPYIRKSQANDHDKERYQTIYSKYYGSAAAPTAGLHFDDYIFNSLKDKYIDYAYISLHVGLGTFQPIYTENIEDHKIHTEDFFIEKSEAGKINSAIANAKKIIPVGTTSLRTLESAYSDNLILAGHGSTNLFIIPSYKFKIASGLLTNFHTPKSSLAVLVAALLGVDKLLEIYEYAVKNKYRFFSYGDAMLIL